MDKATITQISKGDKNSFTKLYNEYAEQALRVAMAITKDKMSAADAVQETFIRVYKNISDFDINKPFEPWFYKILINECNRLLYQNSNTILISDFVENSFLQPSYDKYSFQEYEALYRAIEQLDNINRIPIILKYLKGFSENEIAIVLDTNINTVKSRLFKGRQKLKKLLNVIEGGCENHG